MLTKEQMKKIVGGYGGGHSLPGVPAVVCQGFVGGAPVSVYCHPEYSTAACLAKCTSDGVDNCNSCEAITCYGEGAWNCYP
jgi:hypothetical protein